jgi:hypothetical protein
MFLTIENFKKITNEKSSTFEVKFIDELDNVYYMWGKANDGGKIYTIVIHRQSDGAGMFEVQLMHTVYTAHTDYFHRNELSDWKYIVDRMIKHINTI